MILAGIYFLKSKLMLMISLLIYLLYLSVVGFIFIDLVSILTEEPLESFELEDFNLFLLAEDVIL